MFRVMLSLTGFILCLSCDLAAQNYPKQPINLIIPLAPGDVIFDPNVLTVATGLEEHNDYDHAFIEAVRGKSASHKT